MPLEAPSSVSVTEAFTTIADGNFLYLYDRAENAYFTYTHASAISKTELTEDGTLYFLSSLRLYEISAEELKQNKQAEQVTVCYDFTTENETLYYYDSAQALLSSEGKTLSLPYALQSGSPLAFENGLLYCVCKTPNGLFTLYAVNPQTNSVNPIAGFTEALLSIAFEGNQLCAVTESGNFYAYPYAELDGTATLPAPIAQDEKGYLSLSAYNDLIYAVRGASIREYSTETASFTEYEIGSSSASPKRLNGASDLYLAETKLFIADAANERIAVYDTEANELAVQIETDLTASVLASYGDTLLVASETKAALYSLTEKRYGTELLRLNETNGSIVGVASVYNRYYLLTDENYCYTLSEENGAWKATETQKNTVSLRPTAFTADVFGSLYILYDNGKLYRFTEQELLTADANGAKIADGLQGVEKLALDYDCTLYALSGGALTKYLPNADGGYAPSERYAPDHGLVYDETPTIASFTFGVRNAYAYLLYEGDYLIKTDGLQIPVVSPIPVGNAKELLFGETAAEPPTAVQVSAGSILIEFDAEALQTATAFPYTAFARAQSALTAAKLGEEGEYTMISAKNEQTGAFKTYLVKSESCETLPISAYYTSFGENAKTGYLTNGVSLYKYPYLTDILTVTELSRGAQVTLLGETVSLDHAYYYAQIETETGVKTGYIPKNFVNPFESATPQAETVVLGEEGANTDAIWRVAYLLLGSVLICILVDFLLLRKPKNKD